MKVNRTQVDIFVDGTSVTAAKVQQPLDILAAAVTNTDDRVDNVYTKTESDNKFIANASGLQAAFTNTAPSPVTLNYGQQVLTMAETAPLQNLKLQGRTLVNAMGRRGNCESLLDWGASGNHTATLDTTTFTQGSASYKLVSTGAGSGSNGLSSTTGILNIKDDTDYLLIMNLKALSGTPTVHSELWGTIGTKLANVVDTNWKTYVFKVKSSSAGQLKQLFIWLTAAGTVYVDAIRLYEVTGSMLTETDTMTSDQINAKYPYVDDMKSIANPYAIKYGENLLAPFSEWSSIDSNAQRVVVDANNFTVKGKTTGRFQVMTLDYL
jgi:hypothetical protein